MKHSNLILALLLMLSFGLYGQLDLGLGIAGGSGSGYDSSDQGDKFNVGLQARAQYSINDKFGFDADFIYFYPTKGTGSVSVGGGPSEDFEFDTNFSQANLDFQYNVLNNQYNRCYVLLGPTYGTFSEETGVTNTSYIGGNVGFGAELASNVFYDFKFQYRNWDVGIPFSKFHFLVSAGYMFPITKKKMMGEEMMETETIDDSM